MNSRQTLDPHEARAKALLDRMADGDEVALRELHRLFARRVHAFVLHRCGDEAIADSVTGDTFFEVWKKPRAYRGESKFSTWLLGVARFRMLDELRRRPGNEDDLDDHADVLQDETPIAESLLEQAQDAALLRRCIDRLSAAHRECLHLVYFEDLGVQDVADLQGIPNGTVKTRLFHARSQVRACVEASVARASPQGALS